MPARTAPEVFSASTRAIRRGSAKALWLALVPILLLSFFPFFVPRVGENTRMAETFWIAAAILLILLLALRAQVIRAGRMLRYEVALNKVHYVQLTMHTCVYSYWGWYWRDVYSYVPLILAQLIFAYALDMLLCWCRRDTWLLGFGPFPIILSTNLFLWFRDDWFYFQFLLIAVGILGKEFLRWKREGRSVHIFNPSALSLFIFSVVLIATKKTDITMGIQIADTLHRPPHIYLEIFLLGLVVQSLFRVTLVTLFAAAALWILNVLYTRATGDYNFVDSNIPVSVFLGLHLLVTDPATSPRKSFSKILFGAMYGFGVFGMYRLLGSVNAPEFYDKLLCVPLLNLSVQRLDRFTGWIADGIRSWKWPVLNFCRTLTAERSNLAWMAVWSSVFAAMMVTGFLSKGKDHPGGNPEYWRQACEHGQKNACKTWARTLNVNCDDNSANDCLTLGGVLDEGRLAPRNASFAGIALGRACDLGSSAACAKLVQFVEKDGKAALLAACDRGVGAGCFILGSLYSGGSGVPEDGARAFELFQKSCDLQWWRGCGRLGISYLVGQGTAPDPVKAAENFEQACRERNGASCLEAAKLYASGPPGLRDESLARERANRACELGVQTACQFGIGSRPDGARVR